MSYVKALLNADTILEKIRSGQAMQQVRAESQKGLVDKPVDTSLLDEPAQVPFQEGYSALSDLEARIKAAKEKEMPEGTGGNIEVDRGSAPKKNPIYTPSKGYPMKVSEIQEIIIAEAKLRGIDPQVALKIFQHEGQGAYQSQVPREGKGSLDGKEASFGPWQLYIGGGLGNEYEQSTGRILAEDNTPEGIRKQTQFALDKAAESGWGAWYGRKPAGVGTRDGLSNAKPIGNWR